MGPPAARAAAPIDRAAAGLGLLTVWLANARYLVGLPALLDPMVSMEPFYIRMARQPLADLLREPPAWGPLYALWLKPFVALFDDPFAVCAANVAALSLALTSALYLHVLQRTRRAALATAAALLFLIADANVPLDGKVSDFALLVLLAGWSAAALAPAGARRTALAAGTVLVAAYARPELYPAALALALVGLAQARRARQAALLAWPAAALALAAVLAATVGMPVSGGDRLLAAVREHFAWNWNAWQQGQQWVPLQAAWQEAFGGAASLLAAARANPSAMARHLAGNLGGSVAFLLGDAFRHYPLLAPPDRPTAVALEGWLLAAAAYGALALVAVRPARRRLLLARHGDALLWYAAVTVACLAAATVVYPRAHYLVIPGALALIAATLAAPLLLPEPVARPWPVRLAAAAVALALVPRPFLLPGAHAVAGAPFTARVDVVRPVADTLAVVRGLALPPPVRVLTLSDGFGDLLGPGFEEVRMWQKGDQPLRTYLDERRVDVIVAMRLEHHSFVVDDPLWLTIQTAPERAGFERVPVPGHPEVGVFVRAGGGS